MPGGTVLSTYQMKRCGGRTAGSRGLSEASPHEELVFHRPARRPCPCLAPLNLQACTQGGDGPFLLPRRSLYPFSFRQGTRVVRGRCPLPQSAHHKHTAKGPKGPALHPSLFS